MVPVVIACQSVSGLIACVNNVDTVLPEFHTVSDSARSAEKKVAKGKRSAAPGPIYRQAYLSQFGSFGALEGTAIC
jgi:hypothetical protein